MLVDAYSAGPFLFVQTKMSWRSLLTRDHLSESRVQFYDDPTKDCGSGSDT